MQIYHSLTVDVAKRNQYKAVSAKQLDCNSRFLKIELQNNGSAFDIPNNVTIAMAVERNGETKAFNCKYEGDYILAPLDTWVLQESGYVDCEIILLDTETNSKLSSFLFSLEIEQNIYNDEDIKSDENYDLLLTLIGDVKSSQIVSITEKVEGLKHTYTVLFGNGESKEFVISDGAKGDPGTPGKDGAPGKDGTPGKDGYTPIKGVDYFDGAKGEKGDKGDKGDKGEQGIQGLPGASGQPGTTVYSELSDKPSINNVTLVGNKTLEELGIVNYDDTEIKAQIATKQNALTTEQLSNIAAVPNKQDKLIAGTSMELIRDFTLTEDRAAVGLRTYADGYLGVKDIAIEITVKGNSSGVSGKGINMHINGSTYWIAMLKNAFEKDENDTYCWRYLLTGFMTADGYFILTNNLSNGDITAFSYTLQYAHSFNTIFDPGAVFNPATTPYISQIRLSTNDNALGIGAGTRFRVWGTKYYG